MGKVSHAALLGRRGGLARARTTSAVRLSEIGTLGARARWPPKILPSFDAMIDLSDYYAETVMKRPGSIKEDLIILSEVLRDTPHAIIGGIAIQPRRPDPRPTRDIDVAVPTWDDIPREKLRAAGFRGGRRFQFSENWKAPGGTDVQFSADAGFVGVVKRREMVSGSGVSFQAASVADLIRLKTAAALEPRRRFTKKLTDIQDVLDLVARHRSVYDRMSAADRAEVGKLLALADLLKSALPGK